VTTTTASGRIADVGRHSVDGLRELVLTGGFLRAAVVDKHTGEIVDSEARALFSALPTISPATTVDELLEHRMIKRAPRDLHRAYHQPKYRPGRELFVRTKLSWESRGRRGVGFFDSNGEPGFTHRAVLRAQCGDEFVVDVEGAPSPLMFTRADVFAWNEPSGLPSSGGAISGVQVDYSSPLMKAHICAAYLELGDELAELDFAAQPEDILEYQQVLVHKLASRVNMSYAGRSEGYAGARSGSLLRGGQGVCFVQRAVAGAFLSAFSRVLAFETQMAVGSTLRLGVPHGFVVITLRPSLKRFVCDPAWAEPMTDLRVAFFDANWGHDRRLVEIEGQQDVTVRPAEVDLPEEDAP